MLAGEARTPQLLAVPDGGSGLRAGPLTAVGQAHLMALASSRRGVSGNGKPA
jgi:hypothetical protein